MSSTGPIKVLVIPVSLDKPLYEAEINGSIEAGTQLRQMQLLVGGYIEALSGPAYDSDPITWVNEDGIAQGLDINIRATAYANFLWGSEVTMLFGQAFITGPRDGAEDVTSLSDDQIREIKELLS